jgi:hypothetical protein
VPRAATSIIPCLLALFAFLGFSARAVAAAPPEFFGVAPDQTVSNEVAAGMADAGVGTLRFGIWWSNAQPTPLGRYDWTESDASVGNAARNGMSALPYLVGSPAWATGEMNDPPVDSDAERAGWRAFVLAAVRRYGAGGSFWLEHPEIPARPITAWEVWNEENSPGFWGETRTPSPREYGVVLRLASSAVGEADPTAEVIVGGLNIGGGINPRRFLDRLYERPGGPQSFDGVALHPYAASPLDSLRQLEAGRAVMVKHGDEDGSVWVTEIGWASGRFGSEVDSSPRGQATKLQRSFRRMLQMRRQLNLRRVVWFTWQDNPLTPPCSWCADAGLLNPDGTPKPALRAFERFAD